jgi:hypothetical protein
MRACHLQWQRCSPHLLATSHRFEIVSNLSLSLVCWFLPLITSYNSLMLLRSRPLSAQLSTSHALSKALADYEHETAALRNALQDQEIFTALCRASHEDVLKETISVRIHYFLAPDGLAHPVQATCALLGILDAQTA